MQASDDYEDSDGACDKDDKGCNDILDRIKIKKKRPCSNRWCIPTPSENDDWGPDGFQIQFTFALGVPGVYYENYKDYGLWGGNNGNANVPTLVFFGGSLVFDRYGGVQPYFLTLDQDPWNLEQGPLQEIHPSYMLAANSTLAIGVINGEGFDELGTKAYEGQSRDWSGGLGPISYDYYQGYNNQTGQTDPNWLSGHDIGIGIGQGSPLSGGVISTYAHPIPFFPRLGPPPSPSD